MLCDSRFFPPKHFFSFFALKEVWKVSNRAVCVYHAQSCLFTLQLMLSVLVLLAPLTVFWLLGLALGIVAGTLLPTPLVVLLSVFAFSLHFSWHP